MIVSDLSPAQFQGRLQNEGVFLQTGEYVYRIRSDVPNLAPALQKLYAFFPLIGGCEFSDFHVEAKTCRPLSHRLRLRARIVHEGFFETAPVPIDQSVAYLEWSFNRCIFSEVYDRLLLHGAVLERDGRALIIAGVAGAGKSTLAAGLCINKWRLLSDELTILSPQDGSLMGLARPIALKNESIEIIRSLSAEDDFGPVCKGTPKGSVVHMRPPAESVYRGGERVWPACFLFVRFRSGCGPTVQRVSKAQAFIRLAQLAGINYGVMGDLGFRVLSQAVDRATCVEFEYGDIEQAIRFFDSDYEDLLASATPNGDQ